ncbi:MAG TPA: flavodoxin domain-containing protein [Steroidobacteraceae bacterium]|nr:flavodoxin domain-containing protein [Steroidobacteraceae bacterium]
MTATPAALGRNLGSIPRRLLHIVFASTSGHTEYVLDVLIDSLQECDCGWDIELSRAERAQPQDLMRGDVLLLASSTWNTWSIEGQLNPHMWGLLHDRAKNLDLAGKHCTAIGLGDRRYFYTARAVEHLRRYIESHHGLLIVPILAIIDEPYGQEETIKAWGQELLRTAAPSVDL